ncbi:polyprenyl synthetase family protein [Streptomyces chartreusis]|uniref:polyprenyl synthetase family protein n=1 Tax=Streptomyces chartreusis TaxID=1969 RepID=UPI00381D1395
MAPLFAAVRRLLFTNGKRLRPTLCITGWQAGGAPGDQNTVIRIAAALELFQTFALIHDDIMDGSDARRGQPSAHRALAAAYLASGGRHSRAEAHGRAAAILLGDLMLVWSDEMLARAGLRARARARISPLMDSMRAEMVYGQYLDLLSTNRLSGDVAAALRIARYKTGKYTVERPLHIGVTLAGADRRLLSTCTDFAIPVGEAFQLRDDLLGVFGDPAQTGKPVGDDIREGKATALLALAVRDGSEADLHLLSTRLGDPELGSEDIDRIRTVLETTGARQRVEEMINTRRDAALATLDRADLPPHVARTLRQIVSIATERQS